MTYNYKLKPFEINRIEAISRQPDNEWTQMTQPTWVVRSYQYFLNFSPCFLLQVQPWKFAVAEFSVL